MTSRRSAIAAILAVLLIAGWRIGTLPPNTLWRDWVLLLLAYGIYSHFKRSSPAWPIVTSSLMMFLLGIYAQGQFRHLSLLLGSGP